MTEFKPPIRRDVSLYMCEVCGETYSTTPEMHDAALSNFEKNAPVLEDTYTQDGKELSGQLAVVCDECFKKFAAWYKETYGVELAG